MSQRAEVRVKKTNERRALRFAGLEFAPPLTAEERAEAEQVLADASASGDYSNVPPPREPSIAVWADEQRHHYVLLGDEEGNPVAVRFKIGPVRDPRRDDLAEGGFVPAKALKAMQPKPKQWAPGTVGGSGGGGGGGGAEEPAPLTEKQQKRKSELLQILQKNLIGLAKKGAGDLLGGLLTEGGSMGGLVENIVAPNGGDVLGMAGKGLAGMGIGGVLSAASGALFSKVWGVDDSSSAGEQVAHHLAQELAGLMQAELQQLMEGLFTQAGTESAGLSWKEQFTGMSAPAGLPVIRMGDMTDHGGVVQSGEATVLVEGMLAARMTDVQLCPKIEPGPVPHIGGTIDQGDPLVVVGGHEAARHDHLSLCTGCGLLTKVVQGQSSVQIGTDSTAPPAAKPKEAPKAGGGGSGAGSSRKQPKEDPAAQDVNGTAAAADVEEGVPGAESSSPGDAPAAEGDQGAVAEENAPSIPDDDGEVDPVGISDSKGEFSDAEKELLKDLAEKSGDARRALLTAEHKTLEEAVKLRWAQILEIEKDMARSASNPDRLQKLTELHRKLMGYQFHDVLDEAMRWGALTAEQKFLRGVTTTVGGLFSLDELLQTDRNRYDYIRKHGSQASWENDVGQAAKFTVSALLAIPNRFGLVVNIGAPQIAEQIGQAVGRGSYAPIKWVADRIRGR